MPSYKEFPPDKSLQSVVECFWHSSVLLNGSIVQDFPTPILQGMAFNFKGQDEFMHFDNKEIHLHKTVYLFGQPVQHRTSVSNEKGIEIIGVKFKPLGIYALTGINMKHIANEIISADDIWGREIELLCEQMQEAGSAENAIKVLEQYLIKKYVKNDLSVDKDCVQNALKLLHIHQGNLEIKDLQYHTNTSRKTLERAFVNQIGVLPKLYSRISRYNIARRTLENNKANWQDIIHDCGYFDQSHFISEFKHFSGDTPGNFLKNNKDF